MTTATVAFDYCSHPFLHRIGPKDYSELIRVENNSLKGYLRVYADEESEMASIVTGRPVRVVDEVWRDVDLIKEWILQCAKHHSECSERGAIWRDLPLPTRVLGIRGRKDGTIHLHTSNGERGRWIALSHRWGSQNMPKLKTDNIQQMHSSIPLQDLPQTFQDTVLLAELLDIEYIWIDALCIIQDSPADWEYESSRMRDVYANSFITVAAAASEDSGNGYMRHSCPEETLKGCSLRLSPTEEIWFASRIDNRVPQPRRAVPLARSVLDTRGWCLQERVLSPRLLTFLPKEMTWTCQYHVRESTSRLNGDNDMHRMLLLHSSTLSQRLDRNHFDRPARTHVYWSWYREIVEDYTSRALTYPTDKLVAVAGVAKKIQDKTRDEYLAGMWRQSLPRALLWQAPHQRLDLPQDPHMSRIVRNPLMDYRAPSWSWASLDGRICFHDATSDAAIPEGVKDLNPTRASVLEAHTTPLGLDPLGRVKGGFLKLRGPLRKFVCGRRMPFSDGIGLELLWEYDVPELLDPAGGLAPELLQTGGVCLFDFEEPPLGSVIWCLRITDRQGLILSRTENFAEFKRVGMFKLGIRQLLNPDTNLIPYRETQTQYDALFKDCHETVVVV